MKKLFRQLTAALTIVLGMASCASNDIPVDRSVQTTQAILTTWYASYNAEGTVPIYDAVLDTMEPYDYDRVVEVYEFRNDGFGLWNRYYFAGNEQLPFAELGGGSGGLGAFNYTVLSDGTVSLKLANSQYAPSEDPYLPIERQLTLADGVLNTSGVDGSTIRLAPVSDEWMKIIDYWIYKLRGGFGEKDELFLSNWEEQDTVRISSMKDPVYTPWRGTQKWNIPDDIRLDVSKENGWEMAFCMLDDPNASSCHMFGLYNRYTGLLKVFHYIINPTGYGNDVVYKVTGGSTGTDDKYPLYQSMEYGIPGNHKYGSNGDLKPGARLYTGQVQQSSFTAFVSPYSDEDNHMPRLGWQCFVVDMSGYVPSGVDWKKGKKHVGQLNISTQTSMAEGISLVGSLTGKLDGTVTDQQVIHHGGGNSTTGICTALTTISSLMTGGIASVNAAYSLANNAKAQESIAGSAMGTIAPWLAAGSFAMNITAAIINAASTDDPSWDEVIPGKIDLGLDASINLSGQIQSLTANAEGAIAVTPELIEEASPMNEHLGTGVWGLAEDPVIYISKDDLFSVNDHLNVGRVNGAWANEEFDYSQVRLLSFFDPSSVKINLNTGLFHNIRNLAVKTNYAVYTDRQTGNTESYRAFLGFGQRPSFSLTNGDTSTPLVRLNKESGMRIHCLKPEDALIKDFETKDNCAVHVQPIEGMQADDGIMRFYGRKYSFNGKEIVCFPQVYVPYIKGGQIFDPVAPDFVVSVELTFECDEGKMHYSKNFIPKVELITHDDLKVWYDKLEDYSEKCSRDESVGTLANDPSIPVRDPMSDIWLTRTLKMLEVATDVSAGSEPERHWLRYDVINNISMPHLQEVELIQNLGKINFVCLSQSSWRRAGYPLFAGITKNTYQALRRDDDPFIKDILESGYVPNLTTARKIGEMMYNEWDVFAKSFAEAGGGPLNKGYDYWINHMHNGGFLNLVLYIDHFSFWDYKQKEEDLYGVDYGNGDEPGEKFFFYFDWHDDSIREGASVNRP